MMNKTELYAFMEQYDWHLPVYEETTAVLDNAITLSQEHYNLYKSYYLYIINEGPKPNKPEETCEH